MYYNNYPPGVSTIPGDDSKEVTFSLCINLDGNQSDIESGGTRNELVKEFTAWLDLKSNNVYLDHLCIPSVMKDEITNTYTYEADFCISGIITMEVGSHDIEEGYTIDIINNIIEELKRSSTALNWIEYRDNIEWEVV